MESRLLLLITILALLIPGSAFSQKSKGKKESVSVETTTSKLNLQLEKSTIFSKGFTGFALFDPEKREMLYEYNSDKYFTPTSNTKILTFYTSLRILGDSVPALQYSRQGDLTIIWGTGDPSFLNPRVQQNPQIFNFLKNVKGQLLYCPANFKDYRFGNGWMWDDFLSAYQAEKSPFPVYGNLIRFKLNGSWRAIDVLPAFLKNSLSYDSTSLSADFLKREEHDNLFTVNKKASRGKTTEWNLPLHYSGDFIAKVLADTLRRPVNVLDAALMPPADVTTIYSIHTDSLYQLMMQNSDNLIAEQLLLLCSWQLDGSLNTDKAIKYSIKNLMAGLPDELQWEDGSGLSRYNLITPRSLVNVLYRIYQAVPRSRLLNIFPAGGVSGTISSRYRNGDSPFVFAKTGTLANNQALSGYLITQKGKLLIFSFMHNNFKSGANTVKDEMEQVLREIYRTN